MHPDRFDAFTRSLATARTPRQLLRDAAASAFGGLSGGLSKCTVAVEGSHQIIRFETKVRGLTVVGEGRANRLGLHQNSVLNVTWAGASVVRFESTLSAAGSYRATWRYGDMAHRVRGASLTTDDGKHLEGTVNGLPLTPFTAETSSLTLADGSPAPDVIFPRSVRQALREVPSAIQSALAAYHKTESNEPHAARHEAEDKYDPPPRFDDTSQTDSCKACILEAYAAAVACGFACGASFGIACGCIAGIPLIYANCHTVGEGLGQGCCPVGCGASQTILGIGVVYQCCFGGDTCLDSSTGACCGPGLEPCNQRTCCEADAPCRDVGICCPTDQVTCITAKGPVCCNPGEDCIQGVCCARGKPVCNDGTCCDSVCHHCQGDHCVPVPDGTPCPTGLCCDGTCAKCCELGAGCTSNGGCCSGFCNEDGSCDCFDAGEECRFGAKSCCSGVCNEDGICCNQIGGNCNSGGQCCSGFCNEDGSCDCFDNGDPCRFGASSCCSGVCSDSGTCCSSPAGVRGGPGGGNCTSSDDCCNGFCDENLGRCFCFDAGEECLGGAQSCCSGLCGVDGKCLPIPIIKP